MQDTNLITSYVVNTIIGLAIVSWPVLTLIALLRLRRRVLQSAETVLWVIVIIFAPVLGALAFLLTNPGRRTVAAGE
jgi:hypothetical protein